MGAQIVMAQNPLKNKITIYYNKNILDNYKAISNSPLIQYDRSNGGKLGLWINFYTTKSNNYLVLGSNLVNEFRKRKDFSTGISYQLINKGYFFANIKQGVSIIHRNDKSVTYIDFLARSLSSFYTMQDDEVSNFTGTTSGIVTEAELGLNLGKRYSISSRYGFRNYSKIGNTQNFGLGLGVMF